MTDAQESVVEPIVESEQPSESVSPTAEQIAAMRNHLYNGFLGEYKRFINIIVSSPIAIEALQEALKYLDTGMLWVKEAAFHGPLVNKQPASAPVEEPKEEVEKEELKEVSAA